MQLLQIIDQRFTELERILRERPASVSTGSGPSGPPSGSTPVPKKGDSISANDLGLTVGALTKICDYYTPPPLGKQKCRDAEDIYILRNKELWLVKKEIFVLLIKQENNVVLIIT